MARVRITINGATSSFAVVPFGSTVNLTNDGDGGESTWLWAIATGSQPSGSYDGFNDPTSETPTLTPQKEGTYVGTLIVDADQSLTSSFAVAVRHMKSWLRSPGAGEKTEESGSYGWAYAVQEIHDKLDEEIGDGGTVVGLAKTALTRGELVRPTGSLIIKSGSDGEIRTLEFGRISGEATGSFQTTVFMVEGEVASGSNSNPISGSLFTARLHGIFGPLTGTSPAIGDDVFMRDDGVISLALDSVDRKVGHVVTTEGNTYYINFDGTADRRPDITESDLTVNSLTASNTDGITVVNLAASGDVDAGGSLTGSGGVLASAPSVLTDLTVNSLTASNTDGITVVNLAASGDVDAGGSLTGSGGLLTSAPSVMNDVTVNQLTSSDGILCEGTGTFNGGVVLVQADGAGTGLAHATLNFTGSGGTVITTTEAAGGVVNIDISGSVGAAAAGSGIVGVEWQETGSLEATSATASFTGSGGIVVSVNDAAGVTTIDISGSTTAAAATKGYLFALMTGSQVFHSGSRLIFDNVIESSGITDADGVFTLDANKAYELECALRKFNVVTGGYFQWRWFKTNENEGVGNFGVSLASNSTSWTSSQHCAAAIISTTASLDVEVRFEAGDANASVAFDHCYLKIIEI